MAQRGEHRVEARAAEATPVPFVGRPERGQRGRGVGRQRAEVRGHEGAVATDALDQIEHGVDTRARDGHEGIGHAARSAAAVSSTARRRAAIATTS